jgi:hypothetical protein
MLDRMLKREREMFIGVRTPKSIDSVLAFSPVFPSGEFSLIFQDPTPGILL